VSSRAIVTAALIVKDEEDKLGRCLASIAPWCDDVVVVDTGSTDDTVAIARAAGATVLHHPWQGDFAAARNHALDNATGDWILYIDADEVVEPVARHLAHATLRGSGALGLRVWFQDRPGFTPYREYRLWRNRPDIRFEGRMHETPVPDLRRIVAEEGLEILDTEVFRIRHDGYEGDQTAKHLRNLPLLEQRVVELPTRVYLWNHLGNVRAALGDHAGALAAWQTGVDVVRRLGLVDRTDVLAYAGLGLELVRRGTAISELCDELDALAPWYRTRIWMRAEDHRVQGRYDDAIAALHELAALRAAEPDPTLSYNEAMFTDWVWDRLTTCYLRKGDRRSAAAVYEAAAREHPGRLDLRTRSVGLAAMVRNEQAAADQR
jgi:glycosyltransferase involved in cell wall biosynthesis